MKDERTQGLDVSPQDQENLVAYLDGELDEAAQQQVEAALGKNQELRQEADSLKKTWELLDFLPRPQLPVHFTERTMDRLQVTKLLLIRREQWWRRFAVAGWVFTLLLVALLGFSIAYYWPTHERNVHLESTPSTAASVTKSQEPPEHLREEERLIWFLRQDIGRVMTELNAKLEPYERQELNRKRRQGGLIFMEELLGLAKKYNVPLQRPAPPGSTAARPEEPLRPRPRPTGSRPG